MNYAQWRKYDIANGPGIRASLFVSGCTHNCVGCFNTKFKSFNYGKKWNETAENTFIEMVQDPQVKGVTILGGEPLDQIRDEKLLNLLTRIKEQTKKNIWIYSGYTFEEILKNKERRDLIAQCDVLVDGQFVEELKDLRLKFRGSKNQRIIDIKKSLKTKDIKLYQEA